MGVRAGFTEIPSGVFEEVVAGGEPDLTSYGQYSIDKAWDDFHVVFQLKGRPLSLAISGDFHHPFSPTFNEFCEGHHEYYVGLISPPLVQAVAGVLTAVTPADCRNWVMDTDGERYDFLVTFLPDLKNAYEEAAARGNALMIVIA